MISTKPLSIALSAVVAFATTALGEDVRGVIVKVEPDKKMLVLEGKSRGFKGKVLRLRVPDDTEILVARKPAKLADLASGKRARVLFEIQGNDQVALRITVTSSLSSLLESMTGPPPEPSVKSAPSEASSVSGVLRRVSLTDREIVVISPGPSKNTEFETTFLVPDGTKIVRKQQSIRLDDLREGDQVTVSGEKQNGQLVAKSIEGAR
jgi:hypothetical protein